MITFLLFGTALAAMVVSIVLLIQIIRSISTFSYLFSGEEWEHRLTIFIAAIIFGMLATVLFFCGITLVDSTISAKPLLQNILIVMVVIYIAVYIITASNSPKPKYHY